MIEKKKKFKLGDFDYPLPKKHIAQYPGKKRDDSKLMVVNRKEKTIEHKKFSNIVDYLRKNDLLIFCLFPLGLVDQMSGFQLPYGK